MKEKLEIKGNKRYPIVHIRIVWLKRELINDHDEIIWCSREVKIREYACCECLFKINFCFRFESSSYASVQRPIYLRFSDAFALYRRLDPHRHGFP